MDPSDTSCYSSDAESLHRWSIHTSREDAQSLLKAVHVDGSTPPGISMYTTAHMPAFPSPRFKTTTATATPATTTPRMPSPLRAPAHRPAHQHTTHGTTALPQAVIRVRRTTGQPFGIKLGPHKAKGLVRVNAVEPRGAVGRQSAIAAGDLILAIDGEALSTDCARAAYLLATAGRVTSLTVQHAAGTLLARGSQRRE